MYYFTFRSVTLAQRAQRLLTQAGLHAGLLRTPAALESKGCGYSVPVRAEQGLQAATVLRGQQLHWSGCWRYQPPESPREVFP